MFPYISAFMPRQKREVLEYSLLSQETNTQKIGPYVKTLMGAVPFRRLCQRCVEQDRANHGISYWRRVHSLPGVYNCPHHSTPLLLTNVGSLTTPVPISMEMIPTILAPTDLVCHPYSSLIAAESLQALHRSGPDDGDRHRQYLSTAASNGYLLPNKTVATKKICHDLHAFFGDTLLEDMRSNFRPDNRQVWPAVLLRNNRKSVTDTPKHVLLNAFLSTGLATLENAMYRKSGPRPRDLNQIDNELFEGIISQVKNEITEKKRISQRVLLESVNGWQIYRHNSKNLPKTRLILEIITKRYE